MTTAAETKKELTVGRYEFFKQQGRTDASIAKNYDMDQNQLNKWKHENGLIGKDYGLRGKKSGTIKTVKIQDDEVKPLKENDIPKERLSDSYSPNKKLQEKMAEKKPAEKKESASGWNRVKELTQEMSEDMKSEVLATAENMTKKYEIKASETVVEQFDVSNSSSEEQLRQKVAELEKEKVWLEEQHCKDTDEKEFLRKEVEKAKQDAQYHELILKVNADVKSERQRQNDKWGHQRHTFGDWLMILTEEVGEVAQAMQKAKGWGKETDASNLYEELIHVSAVSSAIAEQVLEEQESVSGLVT